MDEIYIINVDLKIKIRILKGYLKIIEKLKVRCRRNFKFNLV